MALNTSCDSGESEVPLYQVKKIKNAINLDGKASDPVWSQAVLLSDFQFPWQDREAPPTAFRALWDDQYLYFQFVVVDEDIVLGEGDTRDESVLGSDRVELFFAANPELQPYYSLEMDPRTWVFDSKGHHHRNIDAGWSWPGLDLAASFTDEGYILEGRTSLQTLTDLELWQDEAKRKLIVGVFRAEFEHASDRSVRQNWISWIMPDSPTPDFHIPSAFGRWELVE